MYTALVDYSTFHLLDLGIYKGNKYVLVPDKESKGWFFVFEVNKKGDNFEAGKLVCRLPKIEAKEVFVTGKLEVNKFGKLPDTEDYIN